MAWEKREEAAPSGGSAASAPGHFISFPSLKGLALSLSYSVFQKVKGVYWPRLSQCLPKDQCLIGKLIELEQYGGWRKLRRQGIWVQPSLQPAHQHCSFFTDSSPEPNALCVPSESSHLAPYPFGEEMVFPGGGPASLGYSFATFSVLISVKSLRRCWGSKG